MSEHTPGPWEAKLPGFNKHLWTRFVEDEAGHLIARINYANPIQSENEAIANAQLIAAAPDLLEACKEIVAEHEYKIRTFEEENGLVKVEGFEPFGRTTAVQWAYDAIAKAETV